MTRPLRIEYPGALYHITSRGNQGKEIYLDDEDRVLFLETLAKTIRKNHWRCLAYCLMTNHYHILIETIHGNLSDGMRDLNGIYSQLYNVRHGVTGHILQGRFAAFLIERETYLFEVARYIVLNPVRAGMAKFPQEYEWSSYRATIGSAMKPIFLDVHNLLKNFGKDYANAHRTYQEFVFDGIGGKSPLKEAGRGRVLGSPQFISETWNRVPDFFEEKPENAKEEKLLGRPTLEDIFCDCTKLEERNRAIDLAVNGCRYSNAEVARYLELSQTSISLIARNKKKK